MPTPSSVLNELAARYGHCDPSSTQEVDWFYARRFRRLPRRVQDRINYEIMMRDGEVGAMELGGATKPLTDEEIARLDAQFHDDLAVLRARRPATAARLRPVILGQAGLSLAAFAAIGSDAIIRGASGPLVAGLAVVGVLANGGALFLERRILARKPSAQDGKIG